MRSDPALAFAAIRATLRSLDAGLYDDAVPFEATRRRLLAMTEAATHAVVARLGRLPEAIALLLAQAVKAAERHNLRAARELVLEAIAEAAAR